MLLNELPPPFMRQSEDFGFSSRITTTTERFVNKDGTFNIKRKRSSNWRAYMPHPYEWLVTMSRTRFVLTITLVYFIVNGLFALTYMYIGMDSLAGAQGDGTHVSSFWQALFFSAQTLTTVGYGSIHPVQFWAQIVAAIEAMTGLMFFAIITGLLFARFSRPNARIKFSRNALISPYGDGQAFMYRLANRRNNRLLQLQSNVVATWVEIDAAGSKQRKFRTLKLERDTIAMLPLSWTVVHPIDENSPFYGWSESQFKDAHVEFMIGLTAFDETFGQNIYIYSSYTTDELLWGHRFKLMYSTNENEHILLDMTALDSSEPV